MNDKEKIYEILMNILKLLEFDVYVEIKEDETGILFKIKSEDMSQFIIGHHGANLFAIEHIVHGIARTQKIEKKFTIDVNDYKMRKESALITKVYEVAKKVLKDRRPIVLRAMNAYERRLVHTTLESNDDVTTESIGEGRDRKVVIKLLSEI